MGDGRCGVASFARVTDIITRAAHMTNAATLEWVVFEWPAERTARLKIRETALNFGC